MKATSMRWLLVALAVAWWPISTVRGQTTDFTLADRLQQLESETQSLRAELDALRQQQANPVRMPQFTAMQTAPAPAPASNPSTVPPVQEPPSLTLDEVRTEAKKFAWVKGNFKVTPYGALWTDMLYQTTRTVPGPYTLWVPSEEVQDSDAFIIDARRTRLGIDVDGPRIPLFCCAKSSGRVEIDFFGDTVYENKGTILLRHAYWQVADDNFKFLVGQTWDVISPLFPGVLNYTVGWDGGNLGYRRAQFRAERYLQLSPELMLILQGSLNQNVINDFASTAGVVREPSNWPIIEGRTAVKLGPRGPGCRPIEVGVSGHIGQTGFDFPTEPNLRVLTWSLNTDVQIPITPYLHFDAEFFTGDNLSMFLGGIGQGVDPIRHTGIRSTGGWFDLGYDWTPRLHSCVGYSIDDPNNNDMTYGRSYNQYVFGNFTFDITKQFVTGIEVAYWKTLYENQDPVTYPTQPTEPGDSVVVQWMVKYGF